MGRVFAARDLKLGRDVAVKLLIGEPTDPQRLHRFEKEARAASAMNHPNILTVYDVVATDQGPCIVSELLEGVTVRERLEHGPLPPELATELAVQLADGLGPRTTEASFIVT